MGDAPTTETRTNAPPVRAAAPIRWALPAPFTDVGETPPGSAKPRTAEITVSALHRRGHAAGVAVAHVTADHLYGGAGQVVRSGRVAGQHLHREALLGQARDQPGAEGASASGDDDQRPAPAQTRHRPIPEFADWIRRDIAAADAYCATAASNRACPP